MNYLSYSTQTTVKIILLFFLIVLPLNAQTEQDTTSNVQPVDSLFVMQKSPSGALWRSAVIPGWGQIYNESYWKAPVFWGFLGYNISVWIRNNDDYHKWRNKISDNKYNDDFSADDLATAQKYRDFYHEQRDQFAVWIALTYILNLVDAYVDAHMFDFDVTPDPYTSAPMLNLRVKF
ncbi:MAG: hypothetical protein JEY94_10985 [Melioribacteraceae bacterium]|nr:hypothetical protein [Melioribacteraceae bacterium]